MPNHWVGQSHVKGPLGPLDLEVSTAALPSYNQTSRQFLALSLIYLGFGSLQARSSGSGHCKWDSDWYFWHYSILLIQNLRKKLHIFQSQL